LGKQTDAEDLCVAVGRRQHPEQKLRPQQGREVFVPRHGCLKHAGNLDDPRAPSASYFRELGVPVAWQKFYGRYNPSIC
jgi:hypothetical protein